MIVSFFSQPFLIVPVAQGIIASEPPVDDINMEFEDGTNMNFEDNTNMEFEG